jgi:hypothetical protein
VVGDGPRARLHGDYTVGRYWVWAVYPSENGCTHVLTAFPSGHHLFSLGTLVDIGGHWWTLLDIVGHCWTLLDIGGHCWTLVDIGGHWWTLLDIVGHWWTLVDIGGHEGKVENF